MADSNQISFELDLDSSNFQEGIETALGKLEDFGVEGASNVSSLLETLGEVGDVLGVVALAAGAFVAALDLSEEGEEILRINTQFELLAKNAGLSADTLKTGLEQASGGLVSTTDLLKVANQSLVSMGTDASQLPQIMELARKATVVYGGDALTNFQNITQAVSTGNTRMLKHYGIVVDTTQAVKAYAEQNGLASNELSQAGKNQALLNAALEQGKEKFKDVNTDTETIAMAMTKLKVSLTELGEYFAVWVSKTIGPGMKVIVDAANSAAHAVGNMFKEMGGSAADQVDVQIEKTTSKIKALQASIEAAEKHPNFLQKLFKYDASSDSFITAQKLALDKLQTQLKSLEAQKEQMAAKDHTLTAQEIANIKAKADAAKKNQDEILKNDERMNKELQKIQADTLKAEQLNIRSLDDIDKQMAAAKLAREKANALEIKKIQNDTTLGAVRQATLIKALNEKFAAQALQNARSDEKLKEQLMQNYVNTSTNAFQAIGRAGLQMSQNNARELKDFGKQGATIMKNFQQNSVSAFEAMGQAMAANQDIGTAVADALKNAFLKMIGQTAEQYGTMLLLEGIFPPNPGLIAAGGALIAFGAAVSSLGGGSSSPVTASGGGGGSASTGITSTAASTDNSSSTAATSTTQTTAPTQRAVSINIAGNYLNSQESQRTIMEIMRNETDATDFTYNKLG